MLNIWTFLEKLVQGLSFGTNNTSFVQELGIKKVFVKKSYDMSCIFQIKKNTHYFTINVL